MTPTLEAPTRNRTNLAPVDEENSLLLAELSPLADEVLRGLSATPKTLSPYLFYDAEGSRLFEEITELPEYYLTRAERSIFERHAPEIIAAARQGSNISVLELGAGTATKTGVLLAAAVAAQGSVVYQPVDVSESALQQAEESLERDLPGVAVQPSVADYTAGLASLPRPAGRRLALYIGSSIGNFEPQQAREVLAVLREQMRPGDSFVLGTDLRKDPEILLRAYDDAAGVTAAFNRNVLVRMQNELGAELNVERFLHSARWNAAESRIEMHLVSDGAQTIDIPMLGVSFHFADGESIHTENSYKYSRERVAALLHSGGFAAEREWTDSEERFLVTMAAVR